LREAFANLVHNAIEYSQRGGRVTVRTGRHGAQSCVEVADDGPGIPDAERDHVLEPLYRVPSTPGPGSGLGPPTLRETAPGRGDDDDKSEKVTRDRAAAKKPALLRSGAPNGQATRWGLRCGGALRLVMEPVGEQSGLGELLKPVTQHKLVRRRLDVDSGRATL